jgi:hypothetical protein
MLQEDILTTTFFDTEKMINKAVWTFFFKYGGEVGDWKAEAHLIFMKAHNTYDKKHGTKFSTYLHYLLYCCLETYYKNYVSKSLPLNYNPELVDGDLENIPDPKQQLTYLVDLLDEMKEDAKMLTELIWEMPEDLQKGELKPGNKNKYYKNNYAIHMKVFLKNYLRKLGWTHSRIQKTFTEIGDTINA